MIKPGTWTVAANREAVRVFAPVDGKLEEVMRRDHPAGAMHTSELVDDQPGTAFESAAPGRHAMEPSTDPKRAEAEKFAREIADELESARVDRRFESLILVAGPQFLGLLRNALSDEVRRHVVREVDKNLSRHDPDEILKIVSADR